MSKQKTRAAETEPAESQEQTPGALALLASTRRREREDEKRERLKAELDALLAAPLGKAKGTW